MADDKFSQFLDGAEVQQGDAIVGLRDSKNYQFDFPGAGIKDSEGNFYFKYADGGPTATNYLVINNAEDSDNVKITTEGTDADVNLEIDLKGSGQFLVPTPTVPLAAATKAYVDGIAGGNESYFSARVSTTGTFAAAYNNGSLGVGATLTANVAGAISIDDISLNVGDVVLVKNQGSSFENGLYTVTNAGSGITQAVLTRSTLYDTIAEIKYGNTVGIVEGTENNKTLWQQTTTVNTIGTDSIAFQQLIVNLPSSSTDNAIVRWNGGEGRSIQNSIVTVSDAGIIAGVTQINLDGAGQDYFVSEVSGALDVQSQGSGANSLINIFTKDGDSTDDNTFNIFGLGTPSTVTNSERLTIGWNHITGVYYINSLASGSGATRSLSLFSGSNTNQILLNTDGSIQMSTIATATPVTGDLVVFKDISDSNKLKTSTISSIISNAVVGGSNTQIQYNNSGAFGGDSGFTTNGSGTLTVTGQLNVDNLRLDGNTISSTDANGNITLSPNGVGAITTTSVINNNIATSATVPGYSVGLLDTDTGIGSDAANTLIQITGGTKRITLSTTAETHTLPTTFSDATDSSSTSTGAIITSGGVGIAKTLYVGTDAQITGRVGLGSNNTNANITAQVSRIFTGATNANLHSFYVANNTITTAGSGTHPIICGGRFDDIVITRSGTAATTISAALYVDGAPTGTGVGSTANSAIYVAGGQITNASTTDATATATGALYTAGGICTAKNIISFQDISNAKGKWLGEDSATLGSLDNSLTYASVPYYDAYRIQMRVLWTGGAPYWLRIRFNGDTTTTNYTSRTQDSSGAWTDRNINGIVLCAGNSSKGVQAFDVWIGNVSDDTVPKVVTVPPVFSPSSSNNVPMGGWWLKSGASAINAIAFEVFDSATTNTRYTGGNVVQIYVALYGMTIGTTTRTDGITATHP